MLFRINPAAASRGGRKNLRLSILDILLAAETMWQVARERRQLRRLDEHALKDIGISRADAEREASRPFWDVDARGRRD